MTACRSHLVNYPARYSAFMEPVARTSRRQSFLFQRHTAIHLVLPFRVSPAVRDFEYLRIPYLMLTVFLSMKKNIVPHLCIRIPDMYRTVHISYPMNHVFQIYPDCRIIQFPVTTQQAYGIFQFVHHTSPTVLPTVSVYRLYPPKLRASGWYACIPA